MFKQGTKILLDRIFLKERRDNKYKNLLKSKPKTNYSRNCI